MKVNFDAIGGRRFLLTVAAHAAATALLWFGKLNADAYTTIVIATVAAYITGNVTQRIKAPDQSGQSPEKGA
jgi:hypothetical protein